MAIKDPSKDQTQSFNQRFEDWAERSLPDWMLYLARFEFRPSSERLTTPERIIGYGVPILIVVVLLIYTFT